MNMNEKTGWHPDGCVDTSRFPCITPEHQMTLIELIAKNEDLMEALPSELLDLLQVKPLMQ